MESTVAGPTIAGLPNTKANPSFDKDNFKEFIPKFADYIDRNNGGIETVINTSVGELITDVPVKISFTNTLTSTNKKVLDIDPNTDIIIGKRTSFCYKQGYNAKSTVIITDTSGLSNEVTISYFLNGYTLKSVKLELLALEEITEIIDFDFANTELNSVLTIEIEDLNNSATLTSFTNTVKSNFKAAYGDGAALYEAFCNIADQKIIKTIWNSDWEYGMSLCIGHYLATVNRESEVSYSLGDIAKDSGPRGVKVTEKVKANLQEKFEFKNIMLSNNESKFWQSTEFGRILITLLYTKAVPTMIVVN